MDNYIVSARKYRPTTFDSVVGQENLTQTLRNAIRQNHLAHAYLFCGPRGVGKTTCARIFAKTINCLHPKDGHEACNECESCRAFNEQRSFNIHELDAASNNGVDDIRALIEQTHIPPQIGKYSVYIIDEVHMLSQGAFNALLKTLEEPPSYVIFILATTEKHKVLPTILSRCQVYDFNRITVNDIVRHLQFIAKQEGIEAEEQALNVVAQKADGGLRDALSIFDQLVAFSGNKISYERAIEVLNVLDTDYYFRVVNYALQGQVTESMLLLNEVLQKGFDAGQFVTGFSQHLRDVLMSKDAATTTLIETSETIREQYKQQGAVCSAPWLFQALDIFNTCDIQYRTAKNKRLTVELALVKLCQLAIGDKQQAPTAAPLPGTKPTPTPSSSTPKVIPTPTPAVPKATAAPKPQPMPAMPTIPSINVPLTGDKKVSTTPVSTTDSGQQTIGESKNKGEEKNDNPRNSDFTVDQFYDAWAGLKAIFKDEARLMAVLSDYRPTLVNETLCVLELANPWQRDEFKKFAKQVMDYMRQALHNDGLQLQLEVAKIDKSKIAYTAEEKYKQLAESHPALKELKAKLRLQLE